MPSYCLVSLPFIQVCKQQLPVLCLSGEFQGSEGFEGCYGIKTSNRTITRGSTLQSITSVHRLFH